MATLAILGHATRGKEVIELLEMLGGKKIKDTPIFDTCNYFITNGVIAGKSIFDFTFPTYKIFTLEEFLEKFPYKVGDKVIYNKSVYEIIEMSWNQNLNTVSYGISNDKRKDLAIVEELQLYTEQKEESMKEPKEFLIGFTKDDNGDWVLNTHKDYEIKEFDGKFKLVKKQPQYPKTYDECCKMLLLKPERATFSTSGLEYKRHLVVNLQRLLICRDAYWKIAGAWKPDWDDIEQDKHTIEVVGNIIGFYDASRTQKILAFPTMNMRDAFYENFKELIECCKVLL